MTTPTAESDAPADWRSRLPGLAICGFIVALVVMAVIVFSGMNRLRDFSRQISAGMPRAEVEELVGEPYLTLPGANGSGELLCWVDSFWQLDVKLDNDGGVLWCRCVPSNSWFRNTQSTISSLFE